MKASRDTQPNVRGQVAIKKEDGYSSDVTNETKQLPLVSIKREKISECSADSDELVPKKMDRRSSNGISTTSSVPAVSRRKRNNRRVYKQEVLGLKVEIKFEIDEEHDMQFYEGQIWKMETTLLPTTETQGDAAPAGGVTTKSRKHFTHFVVFEDDDEGWYDLSQFEASGRLRWPNGSKQEEIEGTTVVTPEKASSSLATTPPSHSVGREASTNPRRLESVSESTQRKRESQEEEKVPPPKKSRTSSLLQPPQSKPLAQEDDDNSQQNLDIELATGLIDEETYWKKKFLLLQRKCIKEQYEKDNEIHLLRSNLIEYQEQEEMLRGESQRLERRASKEGKKKEEVIQSLNKDLTECQEQCNILQLEYADLQRKAEKRESKVLSLNKKLQTREDQCHNLLKSIEELRETNTTDRNDKLKHKLSKYQRQCQSLQKMNEQLEEESAKNQKEVQLLKKDLTKCKDQCLSLQEMNTKLQEESRPKIKTENESEYQLESLNKDLTKSREHCRSLEISVEQLKEMHNKERNNNVALKKWNAQLLEKSTKEESEKQKQVQSLNVELNRYRDQCISLQKKMEQLMQEKRTTTTTEAANRNKQVLSLQRRSDETARQIQALDKKLTKQQQDLLCAPPTSVAKVPPKSYDGTLGGSQVKRSVALNESQINGHRQDLGCPAWFLKRGGPGTSYETGNKVSHLILIPAYCQLPYTEQQTLKFWVTNGICGRILNDLQLLDPNRHAQQEAVPAFWAQQQMGDFVYQYVGHFRCVYYDRLQDTHYNGVRRQALLGFEFVRFDKELADTMRKIAAANQNTGSTKKKSGSIEFNPGLQRGSAQKSSTSPSCTAVSSSACPEGQEHHQCR